MEANNPAQGETGGMKVQRHIADQAVAKAVLGLCALSRAVPPGLWRFVGRSLGYLAYRADAYHRRMTLTNLKFAFGDSLPDHVLERIARNNFQQWGMIGTEWARARYFHPQKDASFLDKVRFEGLEHLEAAKSGGRPALLLSAHFGNWEYAHLAYARKVGPLTFIVRRIDNPVLEKERLAYNSRFGVNILYKETGLRQAIRHLQSGCDLVIFADQKANLKEGVPSLFFGHRTTTLPILAALARKYGLDVVPMFALRKGWSGSHRLVFLPPLKWQPGDTVENFTLRQNLVIEKMIRRRPDHWLWMHRKWRTDHPWIYKVTNWRRVSLPGT